MLKRLYLNAIVKHGSKFLVDIGDLKTLRKIPLNLYYKKFNKLSNRDKFYLSMCVPNFYLMMEDGFNKFILKDKNLLNDFKSNVNTKYFDENSADYCSLGEISNPNDLDSFNLLCNHNFLNKHFSEFIDEQSMHFLFSSLMQFKSLNSKCIYQGFTLLIKDTNIILLEIDNSDNFFIEQINMNIITEDINVKPANKYKANYLKEIIPYFLKDYIRKGLFIKYNEFEIIANSLNGYYDSIIPYFDGLKDELLELLFEVDEEGKMLDYLI